MLQSDLPDDEVEEGLEYIIQDFQNKVEFLQSIKESNQNQGRDVPESKEVFQTLVNGT